MSATRALVVGGGVMARGIAARLPASGIDTVVLVRRSEVVAEVEAEIRLGSSAWRARRRRSASSRRSRPRPPYALAVESIAEDAEAKRAVLARAERLLASDGILTTNTSSLTWRRSATGSPARSASPAGTGSTPPSWSRWSRSSRRRGRRPRSSTA